MIENSIYKAMNSIQGPGKSSSDTKVHCISEVSFLNSTKYRVSLYVNYRNENL